MITTSQLALLRAASPNAVLPGIDTVVGATLVPAALKSFKSLTTNGSAPIFYDAVHNVVIVKQSGFVLDGYDLRGTAVSVQASNVTISNSLFDAAAGYYSIRQVAGASGLNITRNTFDGAKAATSLVDFIAGGTGYVSITNNRFLNSPGDMISISSGVVSNNYMAGGGYAPGAHADAIWVTGTTGPVTITNNFIDWTTPSDAPAGTNQAIRITSEAGPARDVTVSNNFLAGGAYTIQAAFGGVATDYSNININNNTIGFATYASLYPTSNPALITSGNITFDYTNPAYSDNAWLSYRAAGITTANLVIANTAGVNIQSPATGSTTLYGAGLAPHLFGGANQTNFVGGFGTQQFHAGAGKDIFVELAFSDSSSQHPDLIGGFDAAKDIIDLSRIDTDLGKLGTQGFTFIGSNAFSSAGGEVRWQYDPVANYTYVFADTKGHAANDLFIRIAGHPILTAANFLLKTAPVTSPTALLSAAGIGDESTVSSLTTAQHQIYRLYGAALGRAPDAAGLAYWSDRLGKGATLSNIASGFIGSTEFKTAYGALDNTGFVSLLYKNVLNRAADQAGLDGWIAQLQGGASRESIVVGFSESRENQDNSQLAESSYAATSLNSAVYEQIFRTYEATLGRLPDAAGYEYWVNSVAGGQSLASVVDGFVNSSEFQANYGSLGNSDLVKLLYSNVLNRAPDAAGLAGWVKQLDGGASRGGVVMGFSESLENRNNSEAPLRSFMQQGMSNWSNDIVNGIGDDILFGGRGSDTFAFSQNAVGDDHVYGLESWDVLNFIGFGYADATAAQSHMTQTGGNVLFQDQGESVTFHNASLNLMAATGYSFA